MTSLTSLTLDVSLWVRLASLHAAAIANVRCEYRENPFGIDVAKPPQSWVVADPQSEISDVQSQIALNFAQVAFS